MAIVQLDPKTVDQIAAGEVLERPASLVKELVENSLDASSTRIEVQISAGGREIVVHDNGSGIDPQDLPLALSRFATSKITKFDDLFELGTFGFRGEALASAASVSRLRMSSRTLGRNRASVIDSNYGKNEVAPDEPREVGTTVQVTGLFENVPARLKFLKSDIQEISQIKKTLKALALVHPKTEFLVRVEGELVLHWPFREQWRDRVEDVLGLKGLLTASSQEVGWQVQAAFSNPNETQKTSQNIWLFVNDRWVQDRSLQQAVMEAYRNLLMHGEWPSAVVRLFVPPDQLDVNVHPAKSQVKFIEPRVAFRLIHHSIRNVLEKAPWLESFQSSPAMRVERVHDFVPAPEPTQIHLQDWQEAARARDAFVEVTTSHTSDSGSKQNTAAEPPLRQEPRISQALLRTEAALQPRSPEPVSLQAPTPTPGTKGGIEPRWSRLQILGQAAATYILAQSPHALVLIDQHAAHERVAFERLMRAWREGSPEVQNFLIPASMELDESLVEALMSQREFLAKAGIEIERGGPNQILVSSCPSILKDSAVVEVLEKLARDVLSYGESFKFEAQMAEVFASMACHSVIRAGQVLKKEEMEALLAQMDEFGLSSFCPHGRPVFVEYPFRELEKDFGRLV